MLATAIEPHLAAAFSSEPRGRTLPGQRRPRSPEPGFCLGRCFVLLPSQVGSREILISAGHHIPLDLVSCAGLADLVVEGRCLHIVQESLRTPDVIYEHHAAVSEIDSIETIGTNQPFYLFEPVTPVHARGFVRPVHTDDFDGDLACLSALSVFLVGRAYFSAFL